MRATNITRSMWTRIQKRPGPRRDLAAFLDESSTLEGTYRFTGTVMLNGRFDGEIHSSDTLIIGDKGVVKANIRAGTLIVSGELIGNAVAGERVELRGGARVFGDVEAPVVVVEEGVLLEGHCRMAPAPARSADNTVVALKR